MHVHVQLFSRFRELLPAETGGKATLEMPPGSTVGQLLLHLGIGGIVKLIDVNGQRETDRGRVLIDGDIVRIFPMVVGG
jgi:molybdopterin converting factor small subunit